MSDSSILSPLPLPCHPLHATTVIPPSGATVVSPAPASPPDLPGPRRRWFALRESELAIARVARSADEASRQAAEFRDQCAAAIAAGEASAKAVKDARLLFSSYMGHKAHTCGYADLSRSLLPPELHGHATGVRHAGHVLRNQLTAAVLEEQGHEVQASKLRQCGRTALLRLGGAGVQAMDRCGQRHLCPICARWDANRHRRRYCLRVAQRIDEGGHVPALLTLTLRDTPDVGAGVQTLQAAFRECLHRARNARAGCRHVTEFSAFAGGAASVEVKRGTGSGLWHCHIHAITLLTRWVDQSVLSAEWSQRTGGSYVVDIRRLDGRTALYKQLCEVLKYACKFADLPGIDCVTVWRALRGARLFESWGCLRGMPQPEEPEREAPDGAGVVVRFSEAAKGFEVTSITL